MNYRAIILCIALALSGGVGFGQYQPRLTSAQVGLGNVDNTSDADKPISTATQSALDGKVSGTNGVMVSGTLTSPVVSGTTFPQLTIVNPSGYALAAPEDVGDPAVLQFGEDVSGNFDYTISARSYVITTGNVANTGTADPGSQNLYITTSNHHWDSGQSTEGGTVFIGKPILAVSNGYASNVELWTAGPLGTSGTLALDTKTRTLTGAWHVDGSLDGTTATISGVTTLNGGVTIKEQVIASGTAPSWDINAGQNARFTATSAATFSISNLLAGQAATLAITQSSGTSPYVMTFPAGTKQAFGGTNTYTMSGTNAVDILYFRKTGTNTVIEGVVPGITP